MSLVAFNGFPCYWATWGSARKALSALLEQGFPEDSLAAMNPMGWFLWHQERIPKTANITPPTKRLQTVPFPCHFHHDYSGVSNDCWLSCPFFCLQIVTIIPWSRLCQPIANLQNNGRFHLTLQDLPGPRKMYIPLLGQVLQRRWRIELSTSKDWLYIPLDMTAINHKVD